MEKFDFEDAHTQWGFSACFNSFANPVLTYPNILSEPATVLKAEGVFCLICQKEVIGFEFRRTIKEEKLNKWMDGARPINYWLGHYRMGEILRNCAILCHPMVVKGSIYGIAKIPFPGWFVPDSVTLVEGQKHVYWGHFYEVSQTCEFEMNVLYAAARANGVIYATAS